MSDAAAHRTLQFQSGHTPIIISWQRRRVVLTFKCCCKSLRVGTTISCGTEFFRVVFAFGTVPVGRLFAPGDIFDASLQSISSLFRCVYCFFIYLAICFDLCALLAENFPIEIYTKSKRHELYKRKMCFLVMAAATKTILGNAK